MQFAPSDSPTTLHRSVQEALELTTELRDLIDLLQGRITGEPPLQALRLPQVLAKSGDSRSETYKLIKEGKFPRPHHVGRSSRWWQHEVDACLRTRATEAHGWNRGKNQSDIEPQGSVARRSGPNKLCEPSRTQAQPSRPTTDFETCDWPTSADGAEERT